MINISLKPFSINSEDSRLEDVGGISDSPRGTKLREVEAIKKGVNVLTWSCNEDKGVGE